MADINLDEFMDEAPEKDGPEDDDLSSDAPITMEDWQKYVAGIKDDGELYQVALAAGRMEFGDKLLSEGYSAEDIASIRAMLAQKMVEAELAPPGRVDGNLIDYRRLAVFDF
jgi:hypothetical protein